MIAVEKCRGRGVVRAIPLLVFAGSGSHPVAFEDTAGCGIVGN